VSVEWLYLAQKCIKFHRQPSIFHRFSLERTPRTPAYRRGRGWEGIKGFRPLTEDQLCRLQSVLHAAARIIFSARKFDHVTPLLREFHLLRVPERITFKLASRILTAQYQCTWPTALIAWLSSKRSGVCVCVPAR